MAIAFDAATELTLTASGTSNTTAVTVTGANRLLLVWTLITATTDILTDVTYNGVSMTKLQTIQESPNNFYNYLHAVIAPATGTNNVVQTTSGATLIFGASVSYTGVSQSAVDNSASGIEATNQTSRTQAVTTIADNCWLAGMFRAVGSGTPAAGTNTTGRLSGATGGYLFGDSNAAETPPGSFSLQATIALAQPWVSLAASFAPAGAASASLFRPSLLAGLGSGGSFFHNPLG